MIKRTLREGPRSLMNKKLSALAILIASGLAHANPTDITSSNSTLTEADGNSGSRTLIVNPGEVLSSIEVTNDGSDLHTQLQGPNGRDWHYHWNNSVLQLINDNPGMPAPAGTYTFGWSQISNDLFSIQFVFGRLDIGSAAGRLLGSTAQTQIQSGSFQFQTLSHQINNIAGSIASQSSSMNFVALSPPPTATSGEYQLVSYEEPSIDTVDYQDSSMPLRGRTYQGSPVARGGWGAWTQAYGIGGSADSHLGVAGLDYGAGGTQMGIYRSVDDHTLVGFYGGYGYQSVDTDENSEADVNSGMVGSFLRRNDNDGNYYILAGNAGYDDYETSRSGDITGNFDGVQTGVYLERGWTHRLNRVIVGPNVGLQHIWIHQDDHTESGVGGVTLDDLDARSLRSLVGSNFTFDRQFSGALGYCWMPNARANWMHEFLDTSSVVTGSASGSSFSVAGLDLGRDWAILGLGLSGNRNRAVTLFANYDLQFNGRQEFHTGSGGLIWMR